MANAPVKVFRKGTISAAVWAQKGNNGQTFYNISPERRYTDDKGEWKTSNSYSFTDALVLGKLLQLATDHIAELGESVRDQAEAEAA